MFFEEEPISITWRISSTNGLPIAQTVFDVITIDYKGLVTYITNPTTDYITPTGNIEGSMTFTFTPNHRGPWTVLIVTGVSSNYKILDTVKISVACDTPIAKLATKSITSFVSHPKCILKGPITSNTPAFADLEEIYAFASDGTNIIIGGRDKLLGGGVFKTDHTFSQVTQVMTGPQVPVNPGFSEWVDWVVYAPSLGMFVIGASNGGYMHYSTDGGLTWTESNYGGSWTTGSGTIISLEWNEALGVMYACKNGTLLSISTDGINWSNQSATEALGGVHPEQLKHARHFDISLGEYNIIAQWEEYCWKASNSGGSTGWTKTPNNGLIGGVGGTWGTYNWNTDGVHIFASGFGNIIWCTNPESETNWNEYEHTVLPWNPGEDILFIGYFAEYDRPYIVCVETGTFGASGEWYDSETITNQDFALMTNPHLNALTLSYLIRQSKTQSQLGKYYANVGQTGKWGMIIDRWRGADPDGDDGNSFIIMKS